MADYDVTFGDGKYRLTWTQGEGFQAFRHGEPWSVRTQSLLGDGMVLCLVMDLAEARTALERANRRNARLEEETHPAEGMGR